MARFELKLPKMGESVAEATITNWLKEVGDKIEADEAVLEIATDKVDSEVPSEVSGILVEQLFGKDDLVQVGQTIAIIETEGGDLIPVVKQAVVPEAVASPTTSPTAVSVKVSEPMGVASSMFGISTVTVTSTDSPASNIPVDAGASVCHMLPDMASEISWSPNVALVTV